VLLMSGRSNGLAHPGIPGRTAAVSPGNAPAAANMSVMQSGVIPPAGRLAGFDSLRGLVACLMVLTDVVAMGPVPTGLAAWLLATAPLPWLSRISNSLHLVHRLVLGAALHATDGRLPTLAAATPAVPVALLAAALFHRLVEAPALLLSHRLAGAAGWR
jgi:peptidoglycan/LPS O-acetylase OafA/YrhL